MESWLFLSCCIIICQNLRALFAHICQCAVHCCVPCREQAGGQVCTHRPLPAPATSRLCLDVDMREHVSPISLKLSLNFKPSCLLLSWSLSGLKSFPSKCALVSCAQCLPGPVHFRGEQLAPVASPSFCLNLELTRKAFYAERIECLVFCFLVRYSGPTWHLSRTMFPLSRDPIPSVTLLLPNLHTTIFALRTHVHLPAVRRSVRVLTLSRRRLTPPKRLGLDQTVTRCLQG